MVRFAGYIHPHPLLHHIDFKIQIESSKSTPQENLANAIEDLGSETDHLMQQFQNAVDRYKQENRDVMME